MKRRILAIVAMWCLLALLPASASTIEIDLVFSDKTQNQETTEETKSDESTLQDRVNDASASVVGALGKKDWAAKAAAVKKTGDWREDVVAVANSQVGYKQPSNGMTIYAEWAGLDETEDEEDRKAAEDWTALFINWVVDQAGLKETDVPRARTYDELRRKMDKVKALRKVSRSSYPASGDIVLMEVDGQKLLGIATYVNNGYASVILGNDQGAVIKSTYRVSKELFKYYVDLTVLMERAGIEVGKGGEVPEIPEDGVTAWTNTNAVYIRKEPTTASKNLTTVKKKGTALTVTSAELQEDGYIWYGVKYQKYVGFIRGDLLELDRMAIPTATPAPTETPTAAPAPAGCATCAQAAGRKALPVDCCYEQLAAMSREEASRFVLALMRDDPASFKLYVDCHGAHVKAGAEPLICLGSQCGKAAWTKPGAGHVDSCPWHYEGLVVEERVVNIEVKEARAGQQVTLLYEIYGATAYQWHEVRSVMNAEGDVTETDVILEGETKESLTLTAKSEADTSFGYYCAATILANGEPTEIRSKTTLLNVGSVPIVAQAILGEEINFTYTFASAGGYQWYVQTDENAQPVAIAADDAAYSGANSAKLTFHAAAENAGALYSCAALSRDGKVLRQSGYYSYALSTYAAAPDVSVCKDHDLCKYVEELANMTREERYTALTETWYVSTADITGAATADDCLAEYVMLHWYMCHQETYPRLLCTCTPAEEGRLLCHPYDDIHESDCPWYVAPKKASSGEATVQKRADQEEFDKWAATATAEMIARAQTVETLNHVVLEEKEDGTCDVYIARYAEPVGTVDADGYLTYGTPALVIAWVDFSTGNVYAMNNLPADAPARSN